MRCTVPLQQLFTLSILILPPVNSISAHSPRNTQSQQGDRFVAVCDSGFVLLEHEDYLRAADLFQSILHKNPDHPRALYGIGRAFLDIPAGGERAIEYLQQASNLSPLVPAVHYYRALAHMKLAPTDLGADNARLAQMSLRNVLDLDPSHGDAYFQMGLVTRDYLIDIPKSIEAFRNQIACNPSHIDARYELLRTYMYSGQWDEAIVTAEELLALDSEQDRAYPWLAGAYWRSERSLEAMEVFGRYIPMMDDQESALYLDLSLVLSSTEQREYRSLDSQGRRAYWAHYWRTRDPDPKTDVNERLLEHYIRIAHARLMFGSDIWPFDARGALYVRYGEPDMRSGRGLNIDWESLDSDGDWNAQKREFQEELGMSSDFLAVSIFNAALWHCPGHLDRRVVVTVAESLKYEQTLGNFSAPIDQPVLEYIWDTAVSMIERRAFRGSSEATPERWVYLTRGIDISFEDFTNSGAYTVSAQDRASRVIVEQMENRLPTISEEEEKIEYIDPMDSVVTFRGENGRTRVEYAFGLLPDEFGAFRSLTGAYTTLDVGVDLYTLDWEHVAGAGDAARRLETIPQVTIRGVPLFVDATRMEVDPGEYRLTVLLMDPETGKRATIEEILELPNYNSQQLMMSDILPAAWIREVEPGLEGTFIRGDLEVLPIPGRVLQIDQPLFIYYELYNLTKNEFGATRFEVEYTILEARRQQTVAKRLYQGLRSLIGVGGRRLSVSSSFTVNGIEPDISSYLEVDMSNLPPGSYILELTVMDEVSGTTVQNALIFRTLPPIPHN